MNNLGLELARLSMETQKATISISELTEQWKSFRNRYTFFGWFLFKLGILK